MKCPICNKELEIKNKKVGETEAGEAIFNEYGICRDCKKQWNLDKHRAKKVKAEQPKETEATEEKVIPAAAPVKEEVPARPKKKKRPVNPDAEAPVSEEQPRPRKKKRPAVDDATKVLDKLPSVEEFAAAKKAAPAEVKEEKVEEAPVAKKAPVSDGQPRPKKKRRPAPAAESPEAISLDKALETLTDETAPKKPAAYEVAPRPKKKRPVNPDAPVSSEEQPRPRKKRRPAPENLAPAGNPENRMAAPDEAPARPKKKRRPADSDIAVERPAKAKRPARPAEEVMDDFSIDFEEEAPKRPRKRKPIDNRQEEPAFSNIPPKHVREAREKEMRENYQLMVDEDEDDEKGFPTVLIVIIIILLLAAAAFAGYWFFLR